MTSEACYYDDDGYPDPMSQNEGGDGEVPHSLLLDDHAKAFSNLDNSGGSKSVQNKKELQPSSITDNSEKNKGPIGEVSKGSSSKGRDGNGEVDLDHEIHIMTERERRKKMSDMFTKLHALLPHIPVKADKFTIVDEAVTFIKTLEENLHQLQKKKRERIHGVLNSSFIDSSSTDTIEPQEKESREAFLADQGDNLVAPMNSPSVVSNSQFSNCCQSWTSPNLTLNITGVDANIFISTMKKPGLLSTIFTILEKHKLEVVSTHVSSDCSRTIYMIHANASKVPDLSQESSEGIGDVYMSAITEILPLFHEDT